MSQTTIAPQPSIASRALHAWLRMMRHMLPPTLFFFIGFNLIQLTMALVLADHGIDVTGFATATVAALLVGKAVLVTDELPFMAHFDGAPLIQPILFKTAIYSICVLIARFAEISVHYVIDHGTLQGLLVDWAENFRWRRFIAIQIWLMVLFLLYVIMHELDLLFGDGELRRLFFRWNTTQAKLARRQRIRLLVQLNQLMQSNSPEVIREHGSPANEQLTDILRKLNTA